MVKCVVWQAVQQIERLQNIINFRPCKYSVELVWHAIIQQIKPMAFEQYHARIAICIGKRKQWTIFLSLNIFTAADLLKGAAGETQHRSWMHNCVLFFGTTSHMIQCFTAVCYGHRYGQWRKTNASEQSHVTGTSNLSWKVETLKICELVKVKDDIQVGTVRAVCCWRPFHARPGTLLSPPESDHRQP